MVEELDVSGGASLENRPGLGPAVEAVEAGEADVIVAAYFDRFFRSTKVQAQVLERVEAAGGGVLAVDVGTVTSASAGQWLSASMLGIVSEYYRRSNSERVRGALVAAIGRGVAPYGHIPVGYRKRADGVFEPDPTRGPVVRAAFEQRAAGATVDDVWRHLTGHGITITYSGVYQLLQSRVYLGELHFGKFEPNLTAHEPLVDRGIWEAVQRARSPSGRKPKSERLLARLGLLRCGSCRSRMAGSTATGATSRGGGGGRKYPIYRCGNKTCQQPVSISAERVERTVIAAVQEALSDVQGRASADSGAQEAQEAAERAQTDLDAAVRAFGGLDDEVAVRRRLLELREVRDTARERADRLRGQRSALTVSISDWDRLSLDGRRAIISAVVERVTVTPGRGADRIAVEFFSE